MVEVWWASSFRLSPLNQLETQQVTRAGMKGKSPIPAPGEGGGGALGLRKMLCLAPWLGFAVHMPDSLCFRMWVCWASSLTLSTLQSLSSGPVTKPCKPYPPNNRISYLTKTTRTSWRNIWSSTWSEIPRYFLCIQMGSIPGMVSVSPPPRCKGELCSPCPTLCSD